MVVTIKLDLRLIFVGLASFCVVAVALWIAFPGAHKWFPDKSSDLATWIQAIGSIGAIVGVWWQTQYQFSVEKKKINEERLMQSKAIIKRCYFLIQQLRITCENIEMLHDEFLRSLEAEAQNREMYRRYFPSFNSLGDRTSVPDWGKYQDGLSFVLNLFSDLPYWEIQDVKLSNSLISIQNSTRNCSLAVGRDKISFKQKLKALIAEIGVFENENKSQYKQ